MVSVRDIASVCGVSPGTVSKALNGSREISQATRERILRAAEDLGYERTAGARVRVPVRSYNLGFLCAEGRGGPPGSRDAADILEGFRRRAAEAGYDLTLPVRHFCRTGPMSLAAHIGYRRFDGLCVLGDIGERREGENAREPGDPELREFLMKGEIPAVSIGAVWGCRARILPDHEANRKTLENYIRGCGHENTVRIGARSAEDPCIAEQTRAVLTGAGRPTCILYPDDAAALEGIRTIRAMGLSVPADVSVAGYGGIPFLQKVPVHPVLTTVRLNAPALGSAAAEYLMKRIRSNSPPVEVPKQQILLKGILQRGESVRKL